MKTPLYKKGCGPQGLGSPFKQKKLKGFTDKLYIKAEKLQDKADAKAHKAAIAVDEGRDRKANKLYKRAAKLENRGIKIEEREVKRRKKYKY
tara:strand:- start:576 stop:851 length:276 start_codon:yes stop_codon:yes gene_type:complete